MARLIVISGAPASGKTTLARLLRDRTGYLLVEKDALKEALADVVGNPVDVAGSIRLGAASYAALFTLARALIGDGIDVIVESNFRRGLSEEALAPLGATARAARLVHCTAPHELLTNRYRSRSTAGMRHSAHLDDQRSEALSADMADGVFEPLDLAWPVLIVRTESGYEPGFDDIARFALE